MAGVDGPVGVVPALDGAVVGGEDRRHTGRPGRFYDPPRLGIDRFDGGADGVRVFDVADDVDIAQVDGYQGIVGIAQRGDGRIGHGGGAHLGRHLGRG